MLVDHEKPVVFINGARQTGKTTLVRNMIAGRRDAVYLTLDDAATLSAASHKPIGFEGVIRLIQSNDVTVVGLYPIPNRMLFGYSAYRSRDVTVN